MPSGMPDHLPARICIQGYLLGWQGRMSQPGAPNRHWLHWDMGACCLVGLIAPLSLFAFRMTWPAVCQLDGLSTLSMWSGFSRYAHITGLPLRTYLLIWDTSSGKAMRVCTVAAVTRHAGVVGWSTNELCVLASSSLCSRLTFTEDFYLGHVAVEPSFTSWAFEIRMARSLAYDGRHAHCTSYPLAGYPLAAFYSSQLGRSRRVRLPLLTGNWALCGSVDDVFSSRGFVEHRNASTAIPYEWLYTIGGIVHGSWPTN